MDDKQKNTLEKADNDRLWHLRRELDNATQAETDVRLKLDRAGINRASRQADLNEHLSKLQRKYGMGNADQIQKDGKIIRTAQ